MEGKGKLWRRSLILCRVIAVKCLLINKQSLRMLSCYRAKVRPPPPTFDC